MLTVAPRWEYIPAATCAAFPPPVQQAAQGMVSHCCGKVCAGQRTLRRTTHGHHHALCGVLHVFCPFTSSVGCKLQETQESVTV